MICVGNECAGCPSNTHTYADAQNSPTEALHLGHGVHARINAVVPPDGDIPFEAHSRAAINDRHACLRPTFDRVGEFAAQAQFSRQAQERGYDARPGLTPRTHHSWLRPDVRIVDFVRCDRELQTSGIGARQELMVGVIVAAVTAAFISQIFLFLG